MTNKANTTARTVNLKGKIYETVASRVDRFRADYDKEYSIVTDLVEKDDPVIVKASIVDATGRVHATGYAEEVRNSSMVNKTSAVENCETSAIGRALAAFGYAGGEFCSADELASAIQGQAAGQQYEPRNKQHTDNQAEWDKKNLFAQMKASETHEQLDDILHQFADIIGTLDADKFKAAEKAERSRIEGNK